MAPDLQRTDMPWETVACHEHLLSPGKVSGADILSAGPTGAVAFIALALLAAVVLSLAARTHRRLKAELQQKIEQLETRALYDNLTGLANRQLFLDRLGHAVRLQQRQQNPFALFFLDLDNFRKINETLGPSVGDLVLTRIARRLADNLRCTDTVARVDGDEFAILLFNVASHTDIDRIARKLTRVIGADIPLEPRNLMISASMGITLCPGDGCDSATLIRNAQLAMRKSKSMAKGHYQFFQNEFNIEAKRRFQLEIDLDKAIRERQLLLHYQPIIDLNSGRIVALEALVRWQHPERGMVSPAELIPAAEESGLIVDLGELVLEMACRETRRVNERHPGLALTINANLSPRQLRLPGFADRAATILATTGLPPEQLTLEVTESCLMDNIASSLTTLERLRKAGITLAIDDFGKGYSSLSMLKQMPVGSLKIDQEFIRDLPRDGDDREIVAAIIVMAHKMGMKVVAEGVETEAQLNFLRTNRCDLAQGFLFSRPVPADQLPALLQTPNYI